MEDFESISKIGTVESVPRISSIEKELVEILPTNQILELFGGETFLIGFNDQVIIATSGRKS